MTEALKTLKDISKIYIEIGETEIVKTDDLRQEAIKWVKHIKEDIKQLDEIESKPQSPLGRMATKGLDEVLEGQIKWIEDFFNLTEEDLK